MCTSLFDAQGSITTPDNKTPRRDGKPIAGPAPIRSTDVALGDGLADTAKQAILTRRERMRIALEGS
jgi:hypothetical protein